MYFLTRGSLLDTGSSRGFPADPWSDNIESDDTRNKGVNELRQQQHQIIAGIIQARKMNSTSKARKSILKFVSKIAKFGCEMV